MVTKDQPLRRLPKPLRKSLRVRLHDRRGHYPALSVHSPKARLIYQDGLIFSAVQVELQERHGISAELYSEQNYLTLEEIRFFAAVSMSLPPMKGVFYLYPLATERDLPRGSDNAIVLRAAHELAKAHVWPTSDYQYHSESVDLSLITKFVEQISLTDHLLMRGLGALVSAQMLWMHSEFNESATGMLHIACEVSYRLILRKLIAQGIPKPSNIDAGNYLDEVFDQVGIGRSPGYFKSYYDNRIKAVHPESQFGIFPYPPLQADDYYFLRNDLTEIFAFLSIEHKWPAHERY